MSPATQSFDLDMSGVDASDPGASGSKKAPKRKKTGCITCRVRKKVCVTLTLGAPGRARKLIAEMRRDEASLSAVREAGDRVYGLWREAAAVDAGREQQRESARGSEIHKAKARRSRRGNETDSRTSLSETSDRTSDPLQTLPLPLAAELDTGWQEWGLEQGFSGDTGAVAPVLSIPPQDLTLDSFEPLPNLDSSTTLSTVSYPYTSTIAPPATPPDTALEEIWRLLFDSSTPAASYPSMPFIPSPLALPNPSAYSTFPIASPPPPSPFAPPYPSLPLAISPSSPTPASLYPAPTGFGELPMMPDLTYLHHYLNVVLPLQFRLICKSIADLVAPLAVTHHQVLSSVSSLAALHIVSQRVHAPLGLDPAGGPKPTGGVSADADAIVATSSHQSAVARLRFLSSQDLTKEDIIVSALFAVSFHLFRGGTDPGWVVALDTARRCLGVVIASSPELRGEKAPKSNGGGSPWQRYGPLISVMVWMDIIGSVTQNKPSHLLPMYRKVLRHLPNTGDKGRSLRMERAMGCDNTTFLAYAEIVQLSAYRSACELANCLSKDEIQRRAAAIQQLLDERGWRESTLDIVDGSGSDLDDETKDLIRIMSDVFYHAARAFLGSVVSAADPTVSTPVSDVISTLSLLEILHPARVKEINRGLILPITLAGCLAATPDQHSFFRSRFANLGKDAEAFGNSKQARELIDEVWRRRVAATGQSVEFREVMRDMGWEQGILLI